MLEKRGHRVHRAYRAKWEVKARKVKSERDLKVHRACRAVKENRDHKEILAKRVRKVYKAILAKEDRRVYRAHRDTKAMWAKGDHKACKEIKVCKEVRAKWV